jgi:hypothetical protein
LRANISDVGTVNPRMTASQPLLTARIDHDTWQHVSPGAFYCATRHLSA